VRNPELKDKLEDLSVAGKDTIKMDLKEVGWEDVSCSGQGKRCGLLLSWKCTFRFHNIPVIF